MADLTNLFQTLIEKGTLTGSRSTVMQPFYVILGILVGGLGILVKFDSPYWLIIGFSVTIGIVTISFLFTYFYCLFKDKDALRSDKFHMTKLAIEGIKGDHLQGITSLPVDEENILRLEEHTTKIEVNE